MSFKNGLFDGRGVFMDVDVDRTSYHGLWKEGRRHGLGQQETEKGFVMNGTWIEDVMPGGELRYPDKARYVGEVSGQKRHGHGKHTTIVDSRGQYTEYVGEWYDDQMHGSGDLKTYHVDTDKFVKHIVGVWEHGHLTSSDHEEM